METMRGCVTTLLSNSEISLTTDAPRANLEMDALTVDIAVDSPATIIEVDGPAVMIVFEEC